MSREFEHLTLVIGGAASGKSGFAEARVLKTGRKPVYLATAQAFDDEMTARIAAHRTARGGGWRTVEAPLDIAPVFAGLARDEALLMDCATLWLTNLILGDHDTDSATDALIAAVAGCSSPVVIVSNEVGHGIVPGDALSRRFRQAQGQLNQRLAAQAATVIAVMAGLPLALKGTLDP